MTAFAVVCLLYFILPIVFGFVLRRNPEFFGLYRVFTFVVPIVMLGALVAYFAFFFLWLHQAATNLHALHLPNLSYKPHFSVIWFFVPIANIVMPYFILSEVVRASDPVADVPGRKFPWHFNPAPGSLLMWWISLQLCFFLLIYRVLNWVTTGESVTKVHFLLAMAFMGFVFFLLNHLVSIAGEVSKQQIAKYKAIAQASENPAVNPWPSQ